ncbi:MAG: signal recognition particle protein, partial [Paenibacillus sp.]|nr:signal recognition particle protein [Paenibacillus sp.]
LMDMIPGMGKMKQMQNVKVDEKQMGRVGAIVHSMTKEEKQHPDMINHSRRKRIAAGSGTTLADVNRLIKQFDEMRRVMKQFSDMMGPKGKGNKMMKQLSKAGKGMRFPFR